MTTLVAAGSTELIQGSAGATILRAHHYDAALHRAITDTGKIEGGAILERAASNAVYRALSGDGVVRGTEELLRAVFAFTNLGEPVLISVTEERVEVSLGRSNLAEARIEMFGRAKNSVCDVTRGVIAGTLAAALGRNYSVSEVECAAGSGERCRFVAEVADGTPESLGIPAFEWPRRGQAALDSLAFDPTELLALVSRPDGGAAGATYGAMWAETYARAAQEFEEELPRRMGPKFSNVPSVVLTEAAHLGTFYSVAGLLRSSEWRDSVSPRLTTRTDWLHTIVALIDSFGWGDWRVQLLAPEQRFTVHVHGGFEALSSVALAGVASTPRCYFARGVVAGLMNVLFAGDALTPPALDQSVYNTLFRSPLSFRAIETRCQAMGDSYCEFVANPLSPGVRRT